MDIVFTKGDQKYVVKIKPFYWNIFLFGWTLIPFFYMKARIEKIIMGLLVVPFLLMILIWYYKGNVISGLEAVSVINFFTLLLVSCHFASYGYRIYIKALLRNGWAVADKRQAAMAALMALGLC